MTKGKDIFATHVVTATVSEQKAEDFGREGYIYITMVYNAGGSEQSLTLNPQGDEIMDFSLRPDVILNFGSTPLRVKKFTPSNGQVHVVFHAVS